MLPHLPIFFAIFTALLNTGTAQLTKFGTVKTEGRKHTFHVVFVVLYSKVLDVAFVKFRPRQ